MTPPKMESHTKKSTPSTPTPLSGALSIVRNNRKTIKLNKINLAALNLKEDLDPKDEVNFLKLDALEFLELILEEENLEFTKNNNLILKLSIDILGGLLSNKNEIININFNINNAI